MGWIKSDHGGKVCWKSDGRRVFDTADIEKLDNRYTLCQENLISTMGMWSMVIIFILGVLTGLIIGIVI